MGSYISRWKRKPSTVEVLEKLEKDISRLERLKESDTERQKRIVGSLVVYSIIFYICFALVFYFYFMPTLWFDRVCYSMPLLVFPLLVWLLRRFLRWYYVKRIQKNDDALEQLKQKKKEILEEVMEKETYKKAKEILERFSPQPPPSMSASPSPAENRPGQQLRQRVTTQSAGAPSQPPRTPSPPVPMGGSPQAARNTPPVVNVMQRAGQFQQIPQARFPPQGPPLPRPILPRERSFLDRLMEYLIGDGPQNRYALICSACSSHNGMALREEFEYVGFRCCYCYHVNAARKQRPKPPSLDVAPPAVEPQETLQERQEGTEEVAEDADRSTAEMDVDEVDEETLNRDEGAEDAGENDSAAKKDN